MKKRIFAGMVLAAMAVCLALVIAARAGIFPAVELRFIVGDTVTELRLRPQETPELPALQLGEGERFVCWLDEDGSEADPAVPALTDAEYTALIAPATAASAVPWLEYDALGRLLPEARLQRDGQP